MGRKAMPFTLVDNKKHKKSKKEMESREKYELPNKSNGMNIPSHLSEEAKKEWRIIIRLYKELKLNTLSNLDKNALEIYCNALVAYRKAIENISIKGEVYENKGRLYRNQWVDVAKQQIDIIRTYGDMLLLNPIARARLGQIAAKKESEEDLDPMAKLLKERGL